MSINRGNAEDFAIGVGAYFLFSFLLAFYPATIMLIHFYSEEDPFKSLIVFGISAGIIWLLHTIFKYSRNLIVLLILIGIYLFYLGPLYQLIRWYSISLDHYGFQWTGFNWLFFS